MPKYVDMEPYKDCKLVANAEDTGLRVKELPEADVKPVIRGRWLKVSTTAPRYVCNKCSHLFNNISYHYCPFCGAVMKEERSNGR